MIPFFTTNALSTDAVITATKTMLKVASTDGVHPAEIALIKGFYNSGATGSDWPAFDSLSQSSADFKMDPKVFANDQEREMIVALCIMTGFADGSFSDKEQQVVREIGTSLNISPTRFDEINEAVKDHMLAQLSHLPDAGSVAVVAKELG